MKANDDVEFLEENSSDENDKNKKETKADKKRITRSEKYENLLEKKENKEVEDEGMRKRSKKKLKFKKGLGQTIFCLISFLFMVGCFVFYGSRMIHYYKIYNPKGSKQEPLATSIMKKASVVYEGAGIYKESGNYLYKGKDVNNYLKFSNLIWRIVKIANDNTVEIVLDDPLNIMAFDFGTSNFDDSDISDYLNSDFVKYLNTDQLDKVVVCNDEISDLTKLTCDASTVNHYVKLPDVSDFLNSIAEDSYMTDENETLWLYNKKSKKEAWYASGYNLSSSKMDVFNGIKPVVVLKSTNTLLGGTGTKEDPYRVEKEEQKMKLGSYVTIGEDHWVVYKEEKDMLRLTLAQLDTSVKTRPFSTNKNIYDVKDTGSIASYLNTYYYEDMDYKNLLLEANWYTGNYQTSYKNIYQEEAKAYVGMLNVADFKMGVFSDYYYLTTPTEDNLVYIYGNSLLESNVNSYEYYRPAIAIKNSVQIKSGRGSEKDPFILEVK